MSNIQFHNQEVTDLLIGFVQREIFLSRSQP